MEKATRLSCRQSNLPSRNTTSREVRIKEFIRDRIFGSKRNVSVLRGVRIMEVSEGAGSTVFLFLVNYKKDLNADPTNTPHYTEQFEF